jgi:hypothetical protein
MARYLDFKHVVVLTEQQALEIQFRSSTVTRTKNGLWAKRQGHFAYRIKPEIISWLRHNVGIGNYAHNRLNGSRREEKQGGGIHYDFTPREEFRFKRVADAVHFKLRWFT